MREHGLCLGDVVLSGVVLGGAYHSSEEEVGNARGDGYASEVSLAEVRACADCLIAFADDGTLSMVMPGLDSGFWVKQVNFLEVK